jgi:hypothetical protein
MSSDLPQEKLIVGLIFFGLGLMLSGHFLLGILPVAGGAYFYVKNRAAYAEFEQRVTSLIGAKPSAISNARPNTAGETKKNQAAAVETPAAPVENWYYERAGAAIGPFKESDIRALIQQGEIQAVTLIYNPVFGEEWRKLESTHFARLAIRRS